MGLLEPADAPARRAGEGTRLMPEQFALQQVFGNGGAIHDDERRGDRAGAVGVNSPGDQFLARARFTPDEHGDPAGRDPSDLFVNILHLLAASDQPVVFAHVKGGRFPWKADGLHEPIAVGSFLDRDRQRRQPGPSARGGIDPIGARLGFVEVIQGTEPGRFDDRVGVVQDGHEDHRLARKLGVHLADQVQPAGSGQLVIGQNDIELAAERAGQPIGGRWRYFHSKAVCLQAVLQLLGEGGIIFDDEDFRGHTAAGSAGRVLAGSRP